MCLGPTLLISDRIFVDALYVAENSQRHGIGGRPSTGPLHSTSVSRDMRFLWCAEKNSSTRLYEKEGLSH